MPFNPLEQILPALTKRRLTAQPLQPDTPNAGADLYDFQGAMSDEAYDRGFNAQRSGGDPQEIRALMGLSDRYAQHQAASPITSQRAENDARMVGIRSAMDEGFGPMGTTMSKVADFGDQSGLPVYEERSSSNINPLVARNTYLRDQAREKMRQPIQQTAMQEAGATQRANIAADAGIQQQQIQSEGLRDVAQINTSPRAQFAELQRMMAMGQAAGGQPIRSMSQNGISFQTPPNQTSSNNQFAIAAQNLTNAGGSRYLNYTDPSPQQSAWNTMATNFISQAPLDPGSKEVVISVLSDPKESQLPLDQIFDVSKMTPQERQILTDLFIKIRGF